MKLKGKKWVVLPAMAIIAGSLFTNSVFANESEAKVFDWQFGKRIIKMDQIGVFSNEKLKELLDELVASGRLTQEQADNILSKGIGIGQSAMQVIQPDQMGNFAKGRIIGNLDELVASGRITQEQADKIKQNGTVMGQPATQVIRFDQIGHISELKAKLDEMVASDKITQEQADYILQRYASINQTRDN